jgi:DNA-directed RNA polymerase subunit A"
MKLPDPIMALIDQKAKDLNIPKDKLKKEIEKIYKSSLVQPGEPVGTIAAQSIGEPGTQMMMRTKHYAGVAMQVTRGLPRIIELVDARPTPTTPYMAIYLKEPYNKSEDSAKKVANKLVEVTCEDLATDLKLDFLKGCVSVTLNKKKLEEMGLDISDVISTLHLSLRCDVKMEGNTLHVIPSKFSIPRMYSLKEKIKNVQILGIHNIKQAVIQKEKDEYVIHTIGSNFDVVEIEEVDINRTMTNDIFQITRVLGIEAGRAAIIHEMQETLKEAGLSVDIRHVMLIADVMCLSGQIQAIGRHGVSGQKGSVLARASFEETVKHLVDASVKGEVDPLEGIIENVLIGQLCKAGTGIPKVMMKNEGTKKSV